MYCPNCGRANEEPKKFCPSCGLRLQVIAEVLAEERNFDHEGEEAIQPSLPTPSIWQNSLTFGFIVMIAGTILSILGKNAFSHVGVTTLGTIMAVMGIGLIGLNGIGRIVRETLSLPKANQQLRSVTTVKLPAPTQTEEPASITEQTTRKLQLSKARDE